MRQRHVRTVLSTAVLAATLAAGCATAKAPSASWTGNVIADRQRLMKLNGALWKDIQEKAKAGNVEAISLPAEAIALNATRIVALFPEGTLTDKSAAKPEIWQKWPEFQHEAVNLQASAEKLRDAAKAKDATLTQALVNDFGKNACGACHTPFRVPPKQG